MRRGSDVLLMKCPDCLQKIHAAAELCPHCGFTLEDLDRSFDCSEVRMTRLSDVAGALKRDERRELEREFRLFEKTFPQLFFSVHIEALEPQTDIRQYGFWLLNRGVFEDLSSSKSAMGGIMLTIDVSGKAATMTYGYLVEEYLSEELTFDLLSRAHPYFLQAQYLRGARLIVSSLSQLLRRSRAVRMAYEEDAAVGEVTTEEKEGSA